MSSRNAPPLATSPVTPRVLMHGGVPQKSPEERELDALLREEHVPKLKARRFRRALRELGANVNAQ